MKAVYHRDKWICSGKPRDVLEIIEKLTHANSRDARLIDVLQDGMPCKNCISFLVKDTR